MKLGAFPVTGGNEVTLYHETEKAFAHLLDAIKDARHHVHVEFFIIRPDETGNQFLDLLVEKARQGVQVRLLYDSLGSWGLARRFLHKLQEAGGKYSSFLPLAPLRRKFQVNMRNHRKIVVVDGRIAFTGGMNIANEYLGKNPRFGYWRDGFLRLEGPATADFQRIFVEDWDFAAAESIEGKDFFPPPAPVGDEVVQVIQSGPDQEVNSMRELIFAAITTARERLWISTPYVVPDTGIFDALRMAARAGVDVRILWLLRPDHYLPFFAARYYMPDLLDVGVKVYQYAKGMMHAKMMMVDGKWGWMGSTNLDYRSLRLNFEANCIFHTPALVAEMERAFQNDLKNAICMDGKAYAGRPFVGRMIENGCRLLSPML
jgi:cardiolipin synthase